MAILQLQKRVVFKEEAKSSKQKQYNSKFGITVRCEWGGLAAVVVIETSFWCWAVCGSMAGPLVRAAVKSSFYFYSLDETDLEKRASKLEPAIRGWLKPCLRMPAFVCIVQLV